ncbi:MAG: hypothetical protein IJ011_05600 [Clostridia bacterium]|nr:hypothetical protein [Clostridia bacterium]
MKFCKTCGYGMDESAQICTNCNSAMDNVNTMSDDKLKELAKRIKINGIIWLIIGICQVCTFVCAVVGILNIISAVRDIKTSNTLMTYRVGLVKAYEPLTGPIIVFIYNLIFGGVIGIAGSLFYFFGIRGYVMDNKEYFNTLK